nr:RhoGAP and Ras-association domain containing protein [Haemonchus contortus]
MSAKPPVPKPRTRFNVGIETPLSPFAPHPNEVSASNASGAVNNVELRSGTTYPPIEGTSGDTSTSRCSSATASPHRSAPPPPRPPPPHPSVASPTVCPPPPTMHPPPPPTCPPPPKPRPSRPPPPAPGWKIPSESLLPPLCTHSPPQPDAGSQYSSSPLSTPSPPIPPRPKRREPMKYAGGDSEHYDTVECPSSAVKPKSHDIDYIENPIYMSLCALRKKLSLKKKKETEMVVEGNSVSKESSPCVVETKPCCLPSEESGSNGMEEDISQSSELSLASDVPHSHLEKNLPVPNVPSSSCTTCSEEIHAPSPRRTTTPSVDSISTPISIDQFDKVVEIAEIPEIDDDTIELVASDNECHAEREEFNKTTVAFFGDVLLHVGKKERKKVHARLRTMRISFHDDDTTEVCLAGPFSLLGCELIYREENTITIRLNEKEATKSVVFTAENDADNWMLLLGECWLSEYELLRSSMQEVDVCGTFWLRQGATSEWMYAAAGLNGRTMFYVLLDSADYIYELDVRKILMLRERVDKTDWCPKCKKKDQKGPFLISLEGCALYLECCDDLCTMKWYTAIQDALALTPTVLEDFRLTADNIPILVDKCIRFVAAYGIRSEGIYRRNGKISEAKDIYKRLMEDPVKTHIASSGEETAYAVADVLRQFFRRLKSPLFPPTLHKQIFNLVAARGKADNAIRYQEYRCVLQQMPSVHYHTLRKLIAHLSEVVKYQDVNKASVENVAKVFGPSLFEINDDESKCYEDTAGQIGAIIDLITGYDVIFEVTSREEICRAMVEQAQINKATNPTIARADGLLVPIHVWERENRPFNVKIDLAAEEVCRKAVARRGFDAPQDGNYAIFEVILSGTLSRRLQPFEKLSVSVLDHWLPWQCTDGYLLFDHDNWPYDCNEIEFYSGKVKIAEPGSKTFHSYEVGVEGGVKITAHKHDKLWKEWIVADCVFYSGCSPNRKAPYAHNVTILDKQTASLTDKLVGYCISFRLMPERTRFLNMIQYIETGGQPPPLVHL